MDTLAAQALLRELLEEACQPPRVYSHTWRAGDVVLWDNRCVLHRATTYDLSERRLLRHVRIAGDEAF
jgi:alpha-ketoglutarate-dependent taurine dioxygenase